MRDNIPSGEAERLLNDAGLQSVLDDIEHAATEGMINAQNETKRAEFLWEVRALRRLRQELEARAKGKTNLPAKRPAKR